MSQFTVERQLVCQTVLKCCYYGMRSNRPCIKFFTCIVKVISHVEVFISSCDLAFSAHWYPGLTDCRLQRRNCNDEDTPHEDGTNKTQIHCDQTLAESVQLLRD